ncbi:MAG: tryptophan 2,3-dioxygenase family protein [bacterium]|nr:tryptophan 2,3-dioxygenase family protein [bacterium]
MDREHFYSTMNGAGNLDYEVYLNTSKLLSCQKGFADFCNADELQFMVVHQSMELWMKLVGYTLLDVDDFIRSRNANRVLTLMDRVKRILLIMTDTIGVLETMSPHDYQDIRVQLGNGSGQESPGFRTLLQMYQPLWESYKAVYLDGDGRTVQDVYHTGYRHDDAYMVAEALVEYDELFHKFRYHHIQLIHRSIGIHSMSLKGRSVDLLEHGLRTQFFPELWAIRAQMTDEWGQEYGKVRSPIGHGEGGGGE